MGVGASDAANMMSKSQMVGYTQNLRAVQSTNEVDRQREAEAARDADAESTAQDSTHVGSSAGVARTLSTPRGRQDQALHRLGRGHVQWDEPGEDTSAHFLPASLQPQAKGAGGHPLNLPYWLLPQQREDGAETTASRHHRLLNGLRLMVHQEIQQYVKSQAPPYSKKILREIYDMLERDGSPEGAPPAEHNDAGETPGFTHVNLDRARRTRELIENPDPGPGQLMDMVA